jgi:hypothetical protein
LADVRNLTCAVQRKIEVLGRMGGPKQETGSSSSLNQSSAGTQGVETPSAVIVKDWRFEAIVIHFVAPGTSRE